MILNGIRINTILKQKPTQSCGLFAAMFRSQNLMCLWAHCDFACFTLQQKSSQSCIAFYLRIV